MTRDQLVARLKRAGEVQIDSFPVSRLVEEWVRTDYRSFLRQLGAEGK
jgi:hypothetical protein